MRFRANNNLSLFLCKLYDLKSILAIENESNTYRQKYHEKNKLTLTKIDQAVPALLGSILLVTIWDKAGQPNPGCRSNNCTKIMRTKKIEKAFCIVSRYKLDDRMME